MKNLFCISNVLLGILVAAINQSGANAAEECVKRLSEIIVATGKAIAKDPFDVSEVMTFHLCPDTTYEVDYPDGNEYLSLVRPNVHILCGEDGSSANNCTLDATIGSRVHVVSNFFDKPVEDRVVYILENILISGLTFTGNPQYASVYLSVPGEVTFYDCIWRDMAESDSILIAWRDVNAAWYGEVVSDPPTTSSPTVTPQTLPNTEISPTELPTGTPPPTEARHPRPETRNLQETDQNFNDPIFLNIERCTFENIYPISSYFYIHATEELQGYDENNYYVYLTPSEFAESIVSIIDSTINGAENDAQKPRSVFEIVGGGEVYVQNSCITNVPTEFGFIWRDLEDENIKTTVEFEGIFVNNYAGGLCEEEFVSENAYEEAYNYETGLFDPDKLQTYQCEPVGFVSLERCPLLPLPPTAAPSKATVLPELTASPSASPSKDSTVPAERGTTTAPTTATSAGKMVRVQTVFVTASIGVLTFAMQL